MGDNDKVILTKLQRNNRIFAIIWILLEVFFCVMYGIYAHSTSYNFFSSNGVTEYLSAVGIAISTVIGIGGIMSYVSGLKWSGFGFAFLILTLCFQYYFLLNSFWTKADIQTTQQLATGETINQQQKYGQDFLMYVSQGGASTIKTFGATATGAFKFAMTITIGFSAIAGRAGPLQILFFVLFGGILYQLNRQIISYVSYDVGGSFTIFMFGGIMGSIVALILSFTKQKQHIIARINYTSSRFNATFALFGSAFFGVPQYPFISTNAMINAYYCISATVVTSLAFSALIHGRIRIKDLMYAPFAGAAIIGTSAVLIFNPLCAILLGMIAGIIQPLFNLVQQKMAHGKIFYSTCVPFVFAIQGFAGSLASGIFRAIRNNTPIFDYSLYPYPFNWNGNDTGQFYRATFISFGFAIGAGLLVSIFVFLVSAQQFNQFYQDSAYWIVTNDGLRRASESRQIKQQDQIKGIHSYL